MHLSKKTLPVTVFVVLLLLVCPVQAYQAKVIGISDGDTITVLQGTESVKIRLAGIDCPEKHQAFGNKAKDFTACIVFGKMVEVKPVTQDRYGRTVAWVSVGAESLNESLLKAGLAWHYKKYSSDQHLADLETKARHDKVGLWSDPHAIPPWEFRKNNEPRAKNKSGISLPYHTSTKLNAMEPMPNNARGPIQI
ncbi:MAG: thermonuclease family protein [Desulfobacteraceae bacterium]|nr:thermonuclease family protein [Desulfobacteraceae bacterium]